ncbi:MAG: right-handed parallel beta-helix repeat-containing protein [Bacteroidota bacterium]|nr:right-handed parallel beta-helix repeat-containing protein [Bacteroidota bacterium]
MKKQLFIITLILLFIGNQSFGKTYYISPRGNDSQSEGPLATINGALKLILKLKEAKNKEEVTFIIQDGTYPIESPILIDKQFANLNFNVLFKAATPGKVIISGGTALKGFKVLPNGWWCLELKNYSINNSHFEQLYVNDKRAIRASTQYDNKYTLRDVTQKMIVVNAPSGKIETACQQFRIDSEHLKVLSKLSPEELHQVSIILYHKWDNTIKRIDSINVTDNMLFVSGEKMKPWNSLDNSSCYQLENCKYFLNSPGEWFLDKDQRLYYIPRPGEKPDQSIATFSTQNNLLIIQGDKTSKIKKLTFKGIAFKYTGYQLPLGGFEPFQAAVSIDATIQIDHAENIVFDDCLLAHTGNYGIWFRQGCKYCRINHCELKDLGAGGIRIGETSIQKEESKKTGYIVVNNSIIQGCGRVIPEAVGIHIGQSAYNEITHNDIGDLYYTGISVGWTWGYTASETHHNILAFNHIHHIGWRRLSDMAGIYTLGISPGTRIFQNILHDIQSYSYGGWGIYPDEGSSNLLIENNLVYNTKTGGFHQHYGENNLVRNNIFLNNSVYQLQCTRVEKHHSFTFTNNIVIWKEGTLLGGPWDQVQIEMDNNLYWNSKKAPVEFLKYNFDAWKELNRDIHSVIEDPGLEFTGKNVVFKNKALLNRIGFKLVDFRNVGVTGSEEWKAKARLSKERLDEYKGI